MPGAVIGAAVAATIESTVAGALIAGFGYGTAFQIGAIAGSIGGALASTAFNAAFKGDDEPSAVLEQRELSSALLTLRQPIAPRRLIYGQAKVGGVLTFAHLDGSGNLHLVVTLAGHACQAIDAIYLDDFQVTLDGSGNATDKYAGFLRIQQSLGAESSGTQPFSDLVTESGGAWASTAKQVGCAKLYLRLTPSPDLWPTGIPNVAAVVRGKKVYDPRSGLTAYSNNPSLCIADYLCDETFGLGADYATEIDEDQLIAAANIDDELVTLNGGGTQKRYTLNGFVEADTSPRDAIGRMLTASAGRVTYVGGVFRIHPAAYATPTVTITEDDLRGVPQIEPRLSAAGSANGVKGVYVDPARLYQPSDFPPVSDATALSEDNSERQWLDITLPFTKTGAMARRIARIELLRRRQQISVRWPGKLTCYALQPGDAVQVTFAMLGWSAKVFEVIETGLVFEEDGAGGVRLGVDLLLRETASTVYTWSAAAADDIDDAPDTNLPDPFTVVAPTGLDFDEQNYQLMGEGYLRWTEGGNAYPVTYQAEYRQAGGAWIVLPLVRDTAKRITGLDPAAYDFRVKAISQIGVSSAYATLTGVALGPPTVPRVSGLELFNGGGDTTFDDQHAMFVWRANAQQNAYDIGSEPQGAGSGARDPYFKDYLVRIYNADGTLRRTEPESAVLQPRYTYTYANNVADGNGTPTRSFTFKVWQRGRQNQLSRLPAQLAVSNPQCAAPATIALRSLFSALQVEWTPPTGEVDVAGIRIHVSTSSGFTPSAANLRYDGPDRLVTIDNVLPNTTYYMKAACYDHFGTDSLTYTTQLSVTTPQINTADIAHNAVTTALIAIDAVTTDLIAAGAVTTTEIAANAVTTPKILAGSITAPLIAANAVTTTAIAANSIVAAQIVAGTLTSASGVFGAISANDITVGTLNADRINAGSITTAKLNDTAITEIATAYTDTELSGTGSNINQVQVTTSFAEETGVLQRVVWWLGKCASGSGYYTVNPSSGGYGQSTFRCYVDTNYRSFCVVFYQPYTGDDSYGMTFDFSTLSGVTGYAHYIRQWVTLIKR